MRKRLFEIIEVSKNDDVASAIYDIVMMCAIVISIIPLALKSTNTFFYYSDIVTVILFIIDYVSRWITADYKLNKKGAISFIQYPITPWAIIHLLSILPGITALNSGFKMFRLFRIFRTFRVFRVFKAFRYSKSILMVIDVIKNAKHALLAVCTLAIGYIFVSALIVFNIEGNSFDTFFDALYWATVSLTTVGYGDIYPVTTAGRVITMISSLFGIAIIALPSGIITAGYMEALNKAHKEKDEDSNIEPGKNYVKKS